MFGGRVSTDSSSPREMGLFTDNEPSTTTPLFFFFLLLSFFSQRLCYYLCHLISWNEIDFLFQAAFTRLGREAAQARRPTVSRSVFAVWWRSRDLPVVMSSCTKVSRDRDTQVWVCCTNANKHFRWVSRHKKIGLDYFLSNVCVIR